MMDIAGVHGHIAISSDVRETRGPGLAPACFAINCQ